MNKCSCGIPNRANVHHHVVIGREVPGGTETDYVDIYVCDEHDTDNVRDLFAFDDANEWDVLESSRSQLR